MRYAREWVFRRSDTPGLFGNIAILAFVLVQCLDGILTYTGMNRGFLEGNLLASWLMSIMGVGLGLVVIKLMAIVCGAILYRNGTHNPVAILTVVYLIVAIIPWMNLLLTF